MASDLKRIFTTFRSYPNGATTLNGAIEKAFHQCTRSVRSFNDAHGVVITSYDAGWYTDRSEKNIHYEISWPQIDVSEGNCICTVGSRWADGILPTKRPIKPQDGALAIVICLGKRQRLTPTTVDLLNRVALKLSINIYVKTYAFREYWVLDGVSVKEYSLETS